ncbi:MAG: ribosome silencing factor [Pseudomonadota bacterium]|nr:ribosome silencing factor [Pseudomonadota bacterium]
MSNEKLKNTIISVLEDLKANDITVLSVAESSTVTDWMVIASGTSNRHVKALANKVEIEAKQSGFKPLGAEGNDTAEWVLVDFGDVIVHVMLPSTREFYDLESLWTLKPV